MLTPTAFAQASAPESMVRVTFFLVMLSTRVEHVC
jgi:hypothetical protein